MTDTERQKIIKIIITELSYSQKQNLGCYLTSKESQVVLDVLKKETEQWQPPGS